ncbi:MAG TPA: hypothetical protein VJY62_16110 [Bacteroidia bacterium]|nr:hypothetical protein [Bacteroidia bacterium]
MRTLKNLSLTLILILTANALTKGAIFGEENFKKHSSLKKTCVVVHGNGHFVHATIHKGKIIPIVMLPVVTISAERNTKNMVQAARKGKTTIAVVDLPEVVITGERKTPGYKLKSLVTKNGITMIMDLPEVVISAERASTHSFAWRKTNENNLPVVTLPEVVISADFPESNKVLAVLYKGNFIAVVNLPVVEITAERPEGLMVSNEIGSAVPNVDSEKVYFEKAEAKTSKNFNDLIVIISRMVLFNLL